MEKDVWLANNQTHVHTHYRYYNYWMCAVVCVRFIRINGGVEKVLKQWNERKHITKLIVWWYVYLSPRNAQSQVELFFCMVALILRLIWIARGLTLTTWPVPIPSFHLEATLAFSISMCSSHEPKEVSS